MAMSIIHHGEVSKMRLLIALTENDKRVILALLLLLVLVFVLIGFIGTIIVRVMKHQGKKIETAVHDAVITRVIVDKKHFKQYAYKKNNQFFFQETWIALLLIAIAWLALLITCIIRKDWQYDLFDHQKEGFTTLFWLWDFSDCYGEFFGIRILNKWPTTLINSPHFSPDAIGYYIFVPFFLTGVIWYLIAVQRYIARLIKIHKLASSIYSKSLENYNQSEQQMKEAQANLYNSGQTFSSIPPEDDENNQ